jgi:hypothetical protein
MVCTLAHRAGGLNGSLLKLRRVGIKRIARIHDPTTLSLVSVIEAGLTRASAALRMHS